MKGPVQRVAVAKYKDNTSRHKKVMTNVKISGEQRQTLE